MSIYGKTPEEVEKKYIKLCYEYGTGVRVSEKITLADYMRSWLSIRKDTIAPYTYTGYKNNIENHIVPYIGNLFLQDIKAEQIKSLYNKLRKEGSKKDNKGLSGTSILYVHRVLNMAFKDAVNSNLIPRNPVSTIKAPARNNYKPQATDEEGLKRFLDIIKGEEYEVAAHLAIALGARRGELCGLQWDDIDFEKKLAIIRRAISQTSEAGIIVKTVKSGKERIAPIPDGTLRLLSSEINRQKVNREIMGAAYHENSYICVHRDGKPFTPYSLSISINHAIKKAGITITLKDLRTTYVSLQYKYGSDSKAIMGAVGHASEKFERDRYQYVYDSMKKQLADNIDKNIYESESDEKGKF
ncbi:MAG: site-specific integrase [Clostridia bacterium]|nr:site-specific integrase [Clostridia bacterium]